MTYNIQQLIAKCMICQEYGKSQPLIGTTQDVLLEKNGLSDSCRCLLKVHHSEEIAKFHLCSHVHRTIYDCHRIRPTSHNQVTTVDATIPRGPNSFCNVTASHTKPAAQIIQDLMDLLREWFKLPRS